MLSQRSVILYVLFFCSVVVKATISDTVCITSIVISGNKVTKTAIILRELDLKIGDSIAKEKLDQRLLQNRNQIFNTGLFNEVRCYGVHSDYGYILHIEVVEKWYIWPYPVVRFADRNFNIWWETKELSRLNAGIKIHDYNFRGRAEKLKVHAILGYTHLFALDYEVPYLDKSKKRGIHLELGYTNNREVWYKTEQNRLQFLYDPNGRPIQQTHARLSYSYRPGIFSKHRFTLGHETIRVSDTVLLEVNNPFYLDGQKNHQSALLFHYTYKWDRRDIAYYPLKGHFLEINFEPRLLMETGNLFAGFWLNAEKFFDLGKSFYAGLGFRAKTSIMENQPYSLYQSLGYKFFVRGFEPYVVDGQHYALVQSTIKYCMFREDISLPFISIGQFKKAPTALYLSLFTDGGYVSSTQFSQFGNDYSNRWLQGFGAGLDLATYYDRVIRIEYSINNFGRKGLYLHFTASI